MKWKKNIKKALEELSGEAHLSEIYPRVKQMREARNDDVGKYKAWIRNALQENSRGKGEDIFEPKYPVEERKGIWRLKE